MADDTQTTLSGASISATTFSATKDGSNNYTLQSTPRTNGGEVTTTNPLPIVGTVTLAAGATTIGALTANQSVNVGQIAGSAILTGAGTSAGAVRMAFPTDQTLAATMTGTVAITSMPAITGTVAATQSGTYTVQPGNTQNTTAWLADINGGVVNALQGFTTSTGTTAATVIAAQGAGVSIYVGSLQIGNTSTTQSTVTLNDSVSTQLIVPANGGTNPTFQPPLKIAANTAFTVTPSVAVTTMLIAGQGHKG